MFPLLSISYLPPIPYIAACIKSGEIILEKHEHFVKQTHRNRALIYGANGILPLIVPVQHRNLFTIPIEEVLISNDSSWQKIHWRSIVSAYRNSAFFEYFEDDFAVFYQQEFNTLYEFDLELLRLIFSFLEGKTDISFTASYEKNNTEATDLRHAFDSHECTTRESKTSKNRYRQVFSDRHEFIPDLSIVDLLFNEGIKSRDYLIENYQ